MGEAPAPPRPRSPPSYPDMCGRRRLQLEVQILNREVGFLQQEMQGLERVQPVSTCCKDVNDFVGAKADPLIPASKRKQGSCGLYWWIRSKLCAGFSCVCCWCSCFRKPIETPSSCSCLTTPSCSEDHCSCCRAPSCDCKPRGGHCCCSSGCACSCCGSCSVSSCAAGCLGALWRCLSCRPSCCKCPSSSCCQGKPSCCGAPPPCPECGCGCVCSWPRCRGGCGGPPCGRCNPCCAGGCLC